MKSIIIREDDVNYFTPWQRLDEIYSSLLDCGIPINLSITPCVKANTKLSEESLYRKLEKLDHEPYIAPSYRGKNKTYNISENQELVEYIRTMRNVEVVQHGFSHCRCTNGAPEFGITDSGEITQRLRQGRDKIRKCFGVETRFFVPPWDYVSFEALKCIKKEYLGVSLRKFNASPTKLTLSNMPLKLRYQLVEKRLKYRPLFFWENLMIIEHPGYILSRFNSPKTIHKRLIECLHRSDVLVLVNHHWEYYFDWEKRVDTKLIDAWKRALDLLLSNEDSRFVTFSQLWKDRKR